MNHWDSDINDDEIRIISSDSNSPKEEKGYRKRKRIAVWIFTAASLLIIAATAIVFFSIADDEEEETDIAAVQKQPVIPAVNAIESTPADEPAVKGVPFTVRTDTTVNGTGLTILTPFNATPVLEIGNSAINDTTAVLMVQAADIRGDNGKIVGSCVVKGELVSKGEAKAGFCSIINGEVTVGVADATPRFEQALTADGYFFRQYPLVVGGQIVENKPKGKSIRRALAEINGRICVVISNERVSFHDFSQALADAGASNAIYLVGGKAYGQYTEAEGERIRMGNTWDTKVKNINYLVWR